MRRPLPVLVVVSLMLTGLDGCSEKKETTQSKDTSTSAPVTQTSQPVTQITFSKTYTGNIGGKYGITMNLSRQGNNLSGSYFYNNKKLPIAISGEINADGILTLEEKDKNGEVTGLFEGTLYGDTELTGKWRKPGSNNPLSFSLKESANADALSEIQVTEYSFSAQGKDAVVADFSFPKVYAPLDPAVLKKINQQLSIQNLTEETEEDIKKNFAECNCGLINTNFVVNYNKSSILSLTFVSEWIGAYSSFSNKYINIHTTTGEPIRIEHLLTLSSLDQLVTLANEILQERITTAKNEAAGTSEAEWVNELLADKKFEKTDLQNFTVNENGITFYFPFNFPHAALALEPDGTIGFTFGQLQPSIDPNGLLTIEKK